ncbi:RNA polymerase-binding protein RbpA [Actinokineospora sp. NBRC 105648]|uniref:RNA polymerase-binding protein RbpA n=1 Tax=Actinokineospora sp. NBRC 105648 TaxID=3032206 RepID=UPI0024A22614|nr:RNA polymerase-binding protein RbpA [Actinokineospora sp. NBRC 105648]GLZ37262.1 RNA polymerase-binding protein RbpA [Actinokineospora sp. NBRC 105648]
MADRVLRGSRLGAVSYETDRNHDLAPRRTVRYACPKGHDFEVPFSDDAEVPSVWECRLHGTESKMLDGTEPEQAKKVKPPRTHWDMLLERRTISELEDLLAERLTELRGRRSRTA